MADSKKYDGSQWEHSLRKLTTATEAVENPLYSDGTAITSYTIKGNTVQNGTPSNPVEVNGVGERTENLFDSSSAVCYEFVITNVYAYEISDGRLTAYEGGYCYVIKASPNVTYTLKVHTSDDVATLRAGFYSLPIPSQADRIVHDGTQAPNYTSNPTITITNSGNYPYLILQMSGAYVSYLTITVGSTPPASFIPYGYKIPISNGQQTIDIYIGDLPLLKSLDGTAVDEISNGILTRRVDSDGSVLPTPTTTQITMPSIPTTEGANSITVDTTVQPSEFTATWTGWHDTSVKEYDGSDWN